jgi:hypothetical protein
MLIFFRPLYVEDSPLKLLELRTNIYSVPCLVLTEAASKITVVLHDLFFLVDSRKLYATSSRVY